MQAPKKSNSTTLLWNIGGSVIGTNFNCSHVIYCFLYSLISSPPLNQTSINTSVLLKSPLLEKTEH